MTEEAARDCQEVNISCYNNDSIVAALESGIKERHRLEARFRKLCRSIVQLGEESCCIFGEKNGRGDTPRCLLAERTASRHRSSGVRKSRFKGTSSTSSRGCTETRPAFNLAGSGRGRSAFREALDEAKEQLANVRQGGRSRAATARDKDILPAWETHISVQDESAKVSISYKEADQTLGGRGTPDKLISSHPKLAAKRGGGGGACHFNITTASSIRNPCAAAKTSGYPAGSKGARSSSNPEESCRGYSGGKKTRGDDALFHASRGTNLSPQARGYVDEGIGRGKLSLRRAKTVSMEAKRSGSKGKALEVRLQLDDGSNSGGSTAGFSTSSEAKNIRISSSQGRNHRDTNSSPGRHVKTAPIRSAPLHHALRINRLEENPTDRYHSKQTTSVASGEYTGGCEPLEGWKRASSTRDNGRLCYRRQEQQSEAAARREEAAGGGRCSWVRERQTAGGERCFDHNNYQEVGVEEEQRHVAHEEGGKDYDNRGEQNRQSCKKIRAEETKEDAEGQRRWRRRGRVLWSTHAEPAAKATSAGSRLVAQRTIRSRSQSPVPPYHGLYARSLRANGINPANFRASPCGCGCHAGMSCAADQRLIDGSFLWRGSRGGDSLAAQRTRAPTDGVSDRLEAGRVLDSLNRRAELLGTMPPTPLRAKAAWMENPGDPTYILRESSAGLLSSFRGTPSPLSTSLRAARADRGFAN